MIINYYLKKWPKHLMHYIYDIINKEFLNMMEEKKVEICGSSSLRKPQTKKPTKRLTKLITRRGSVNNRYTRQENKIIVNENKD